MLVSLLGRRFWILALVMIAAGMWLPGDYRGMRPLVPIALGGILFFTGLKLRFGELVDEARGPARLGRIGILSVIKLLVIPGAAYVAARPFGPDWALGVMLVSAMPGGMSSAAMADLYRASGPFALVITVVTSLACPLSVPWLLHLVDGTTTAGGGVLADRALYIVGLLCVPFTLAQLVRRFWPAMVQRHHGRWGYGAVASSAALIFISLSANRQAWAGFPLSGLVTPLLIDAVVLAVTLGLALTTRRWLPARQAYAFAFCCVWMNNGLAVAFASRFYPDDARVILPAVLMQLPITAAVVVLGWVIGRHERALLNHERSARRDGTP